MQYKSLKNIHFKSLDKEVMENGVIELDAEFAEKVNEELKLTFMDVPKVLVPIGEENAEVKTARKPRKPKAEPVKEDAE
ncbi:TPA: hypothetical protein U4W96_000161 [Streptococcus agalactiae]|uniref:hypothetical protein n=1 Tax=Streptococcus agalactiae TaxID=1311 RepID=UPI000D6EF6F4|nr:hypothetical protein [Streptococcus agalactiae]PWT25405.1 hypothetical protein CUZ34_01370 [Streptococcus agalactiae]HEN3143859.1 hypothetical protein [Streptococcus agalactiae]